MEHRRAYSYANTPSPTPTSPSFDRKGLFPQTEKEQPKSALKWIGKPAPSRRQCRRMFLPVLALFGALLWFSRALGFANIIQSSVDCSSNPGACAYVTFLCDDVLLPAARVLVHSINQTQTLHPTIIMGLPDVSSEAQEQLEFLGGRILRVDSLPYPFEDFVKFEPGINKQCRYTKLRIFGLSQYKRIIYLDIDTMVVKVIDSLQNWQTDSNSQNIDEHFKSNVDMAGVPDVGSVFNTGVMVIKPTKKLFNHMKDVYFTAPSYNRGDQGFINFFFSNNSNTYTTSQLPPILNVPAKLNAFSVGKAIIDNASVIHLTAETKPWSFHYFSHPQWSLNYHAKMFAAWRTSDNTVMRTLQMANLSHLHYNHKQPNHRLIPREIVMSSALTDADAVRATLNQQEWQNEERTLPICENYTPRFELSKFPEQNLYSVSLSFYSEERLGTLELLVQHYLRSQFIHKVYITWHSPQIPPTPLLRDLASEKQIVILKQKTDSLNNRFNPIAGLRTQAVLIADDDIFVPIDDIDFAFNTWKSRQDSIVGFFPRIHGYRDDGSLYYEMAGVYHNYSIILTKAMFINANYLHAFTCVLSPELHKYVDVARNCEDILMNMMVAGLTSAKPVCVWSDKVHDLGTSHGISTESGHVTARDKCTQDLIHLFGRDTLAPVTNTEMVHRFDKNKFTKTLFEHLPSLMAADGFDFDG